MEYFVQKCSDNKKFAGSISNKPKLTCVIFIVTTGCKFTLLGSQPSITPERCRKKLVEQNAELEG